MPRALGPLLAALGSIATLSVPRGVYAQSTPSLAPPPPPPLGVRVHFEATDALPYVVTLGPPEALATCTVPCDLAIPPGRTHVHATGARTLDREILVGPGPTSVGVGSIGAP